MERTEAIEVIRKCWPVNRNGMLSEALKTLIPELEENEDERIKSAMIRGFNSMMANHPVNTFAGVSIRDIIAYLEKQKKSDILCSKYVEEAVDAFEAEYKKQKEQKFTHHEIDESLRDAVTHQMEDDGDVDDFIRKGIDDIVLKYAELGARWQKEQKPAEWSEEDEEMYARVVRRYTDYEGVIMRTKEESVAAKMLDAMAQEEIWLKSLRPQPHKEIYQAAKHVLAIKFMNYLDENRPNGKMGLSNGECEDIDKAFKENDWKKIIRYAEKYGK